MQANLLKLNPEKTQVMVGRSGGIETSTTDRIQPCYSDPQHWVEKAKMSGSYAMPRTGLGAAVSITTVIRC